MAGCRRVVKCKQQPGLQPSTTPKRGFQPNTALTRGFWKPLLCNWQDDWLGDLNPESLVTIKGAYATPELAKAKPGDRCGGCVTPSVKRA